MFKLPALPSPRAEIHELADFAELLALTSGSVSTREIVAFMSREGENEQPDEGVMDIEDENSESMEEVFDEIGFRQSACNGRYPFELDDTGNVLTFKEIDGIWTQLYGYLLLSTRLNMKDARIYEDIDGALLLEEISADGLRCFLGLPRAKAIVFGTASNDGNFESKVNDLCKNLGEGIKYRNSYGVPENQQDDKLDVVAWLPFSDKFSSQLIIFGQCKTGTVWSNSLGQLQPDIFIKKWMDRSFLLTPVRAFIVSEAAHRTKWGTYGIEGGLFFDRCRLMDCCDELADGLLDRITTWSAAALENAKKMIWSPQT